LGRINPGQDQVCPWPEQKKEGSGAFYLLVGFNERSPFISPGIFVLQLAVLWPAKLGDKTAKLSTGWLKRVLGPNTAGRKITLNSRSRQKILH